MTGLTQAIIDSPVETRCIEKGNKGNPFYCPRPAIYAALASAGRKVPEGHIVHHTCENPRCVNPLHLHIITRSKHAKIHQKRIVERGGQSKTLWRNYEEKLHAIVPQRSNHYDKRSSYWTIGSK